MERSLNTFNKGLDRVLAVDPSGTGTTGIFFTDGKLTEFQECRSDNWKEHYNSIVLLTKYYKPTILLYENINFINNRSKDSLNLIRLLGALEYLPIKRIESISVLKVKELTKQLLKGQLTIPNLTYRKGRGKGWMWKEKGLQDPNLSSKGERISIHCLEAYLVYWLWKETN